MSRPPLTAADIADLLLLDNVVVHEDEDTIALIASCPTFAHQPERVPSTHVVTWSCGCAQTYCEPCTAVRREGSGFTCRSVPGDPQPWDHGTIHVVRARSIRPVHREKA